MAVDLIDEASEESFPASDPPATTATTGSVLAQSGAAGMGPLNVPDSRPDLTTTPMQSGSPEAKPVHAAPAETGR